MAERLIGHRKCCLVFSTRFPASTIVLLLNQTISFPEAAILLNGDGDKSNGGSGDKIVNQPIDVPSWSPHKESGLDDINESLFLVLHSDIETSSTCIFFQIVISSGWEFPRFVSHNQEIIEVDSDHVIDTNQWSIPVSVLSFIPPPGRGMTQEKRFVKTMNN